MKPGKVTMQNIADALGVTKVTVHKALNNKEGVSETLRQQILQTATDMGYRAPRRTSQKYKFAFLAPQKFYNASDNFYTILFYHLNRTCYSDGHDIVQYVISKADEEALALSQFQQNDLDGIFFAGELSADFIHALHNTTGLPVVTIDFLLPFSKFDAIITENFLLGYLNTCYLINRGHHDIGFIGDPHGTSNVFERYLGYQKALIEHGLPCTPEHCISNNNTITGLYTSNFELPNPLPTAFVCHCDAAAYYLAEMLYAAGLSVPDDVSLISFDNTQIAESMGLTSFDISLDDLSKTAFELMCKRIENPKAPAVRKYTKVQLIERNSVKTISTNQ